MTEMDSSVGNNPNTAILTGFSSYSIVRTLSFNGARLVPTIRTWLFGIGNSAGTSSNSNKTGRIGLRTARRRSNDCHRS